MNKFWEKSMYFFGRYWGCHQLPYRSFFIMGYQFPLCARCTGIFAGIITAIIYIGLNTTVVKNYSYSKLSLMLLPVIIDGSVQLVTSYESNNLKRLVSGLLFGFGIIAMLFKIML